TTPTQSTAPPAGVRGHPSSLRRACCCRNSSRRIWRRLDLPRAEVPVVPVVSARAATARPPRPLTSWPVMFKVAQNIGLGVVHDAFGVVQQIADRVWRLVRLVFYRRPGKRSLYERRVDHCRLVARAVGGATPRRFGREVEDIEARDLTVVICPASEMPTVLAH